MAIQYMDNFQFYGLGTTGKARLLEGMPWADVYAASSTATLVVDPDVNATGNVFKVANNTSSQASPSSCRLALPVAGNVIGTAFRWRVASLPGTVGRGAAFRLKSAANGRLYSLHILPTGALELNHYVGAGSTDAVGTIVATTSGPVLTAGAWYHIEFLMNTTTLAFEVRVEGIPVLTGTATGGSTSAIALIEWLQEFDVTAGGPDCYIKDLVVWDNTGSVNNTFTGPVSVYCLQVDGDVSDVNVTPSTGTAVWETMDELSPVDTDFSTFGATPADAIMTFEDVPADVVGVRALQTIVRAKKTDGGDATQQVGLISGVSEDTGSNDAVNTSFRYHFDVSELNPATAALWTPVNVNSANIRINRTL